MCTASAWSVLARCFNIAKKFTSLLSFPCLRRPVVSLSDLF